MTFQQKWSNYWYYYKWHTLFGVFVLILLTITLVECAQKKTPDLSIAYASQNYVNTDKFQDDMSAFIGDVNGDGAEYVFCNNLLLATDVKTEQDLAVSQKLLLLFVDKETRLFIMDRELFEAYSESFENLDGIVPDDKLQDAYEYNGAKIAICTLNCPKLEKYGLAKENLYMGIVALGENDKKFSENYNTSLKLIKELSN